MDQFAEMREAAFFSGSDFAESGCPQGDLIPTVAVQEHWPKSRTPCATPYPDLRLPQRLTQIAKMTKRPRS